MILGLWQEMVGAISHDLCLLVLCGVSKFYFAGSIAFQGSRKVVHLVQCTCSWYIIPEPLSDLQIRGCYYSSEEHLPTAEAICQLSVSLSGTPPPKHTHHLTLSLSVIHEFFFYSQYFAGAVHAHYPADTD